MAFPAQATSDWVAGNYRIDQRIASGGMGVVYKALDTRLQRTVALKFLSPERTTDKSERERLLREARAASALDHENIAAIHSIGETGDGQLFIDMGYYEGEDLATRMRRAPPLSTRESLDIVSQIARGLSHAHSHDVIHRDIKPSNVIITRDGVAKIVDFGLAQYSSPDASTQSFNFSGTLAYMAPERLRGNAIDARSDIWSLGVLLYELLAKRQPFRGDSTASTLNAILNAGPEPVPGLSPALQRILDRALEKDPSCRYQSCEELLHDLDATRNEDDPHATGLLPQKGVPLPKRLFESRILHGIVAIALVLAIAMLRPIKVNDYLPRLPASAPAPNELYQQGMDFLARYDKPGNLDAAIQRFDQTTKADASFALAYAALGEAYVDKFRQEQNPELLRTAEGQCQTAIRLNNQLPEVYVTLGRIHDLSGKHDLGLQEILRALKLDPLNVKGLLALGDAYANVSRDEEAQQAYIKAIALRPDNWDAYQRYAYFLFRRGRNAEAAEEYRKVIAIAPDNARAHSNLAAALLNLGNTAEAEKEMKTAVNLGPSYPAYYNFAFFYYGQRRYAEAAEMARKAADLNGNDYRIWQMLGLSYEWTGQTQKAKDAYTRELQELLQAESVKADDPAAQAEMAVLYSKTRDRANAQRHMNTALALAPNDSTVLSLVGEAHENLSDRATALHYIERSLQNGGTLDDLHSNPDLQQFLADRGVQARLASVSKEPQKEAKN